jgi:hypothetical protein
VGVVSSDAVDIEEHRQIALIVAHGYAEAEADEKYSELTLVINP